MEGATTVTPEETIREVLVHGPSYHRVISALVALDALVARVKEAERERDDLARLLDESIEREKAAEARVAALQETLRKIEQTAQWYADNDSRLDHEVDHCLCVEIPALASEALAAADRPEGTTPQEDGA